MKIGNAQLTRNMDSYCINELSIPSIILMENAAISVVKNINFDNFKSFTVVCGSGNNGGDGLAIARQILAMNMKINVFMVGNNSMSKDCNINYDILKNMGVKINHIVEEQNIKELSKALNENDMTIDAILGIGLSRNVEGIYKKVINLINENSKYTLAVDIPSGMMCDKFGILGTAIKAQTTISFETYKRGFLANNGEDYTGIIKVEKIGIPDYVVNMFNQKEYLTEINDIKNIIKKRNKYSHKGDFGRVSIIAGSERFTGAAYISIQAAVRSGAGLVTLCTKQSIADILKGKLVEAMTMTYEDENFQDLIMNSDSIAIGPGMGSNDFTLNLVRKILSKEGCPVVLDADALNVLKDNLNILKDSKRKIVITPHMGEMSRLTGVSINDINEDKVNIAVNFANKYGIIVLLKGYNTIITNGIEVYVNSTGNSKMASVGMGDTLTGIITSFIAQGYDVFKATILGAYIHGYVGDKLSNKMFCVNASHIIEELPYSIEEILR